MPRESQNQPRSLSSDHPRLAIRRHTDRCFHAVEEVVPEGLTAEGESRGVKGYIIDGVMIDADDVAEVRVISEDNDPPGPSRCSGPAL